MQMTIRRPLIRQELAGRTHFDSHLQYVKSLKNLRTF